MADVSHGGRSQVTRTDRKHIPEMLKSLGMVEEDLKAMTVKELTAMANTYGVNPRESGSRRRVIKADFVKALVGR